MRKLQMAALLALLAVASAEIVGEVQGNAVGLFATISDVALDLELIEGAVSNDGRTIVNFYQFDMQLMNVETAEKVWIQTKPVKKVATR